VDLSFHFFPVLAESTSSHKLLFQQLNALFLIPNLGHAPGAGYFSREEPMHKFISVVLSALTTLLLSIGYAHAHGVIGKRFIPSTIAVDDPFPSDEMDLLTVDRGSKNKEGRETGVGFEFSKRLTRDFALGVGWQYLFVESREGSRTSGAGNPEFSLKYTLLRSPDHEGILSVGFNAEVGGIGPRRVAERISTFTPGLFFGKGLGDLPDSLNYLKPLAITGSLGVTIPSHRKTVTNTVNEDRDIEQDTERHPTTIPYGIAITYSIPYLQSFVKDVGLGTPFDRMFPVIEFNFETPVSGPDKRRTTAFANPGLLWAGKYVQLGMEAQVPMNDFSGKNVGVRGLVHVFIDDIWPNIFTWTPWGVIGPTSR
jgi:hypothetical protein